MKETQELRPRVMYSASTRGIRSASECNSGWSGSIQSGYEGMLSLLFNVTVLDIHGSWPIYNS